MKIKVALNGTNENPYHKMGLKQNPFLQIGNAKYDAAERQLNKLGADPIPHDRYEEYIREMLVGFSQDFIDLCVSRFKVGEMVRFTVEFPG